MRRIALACLLLVLPTWSTAGDKSIVAVFNVEARIVKLDNEVLEALSEHLATLVSAKGRYQVVPRSDLKKRMVEQKVDSYKTCYDQSCQVELGRELAAEKTLSAQVIKLGKTCKANLNLYDLKKAATESSASVSGGCEVDDIVASIEKAVDVLVGADKKEREAKAKDEAAKAAAAQAAAKKQAEQEQERKRQEALRMAPFVQQPGTNLYWSRCFLGRKWDGSKCEGNPKSMVHYEALRACPIGQRLPTKKEALSLLDGCKQDAADPRTRIVCLPCAKSSTCSKMGGDFESKNRFYDYREAAIWLKEQDKHPDLDGALGCNFHRGGWPEKDEAHISTRSEALVPGLHVLCVKNGP